MATSVLSRPRSACSSQAGNMYDDLPQMYVDTHTGVGENIITPGLKEHLSKFYQKASPADRARCLELLTSLDIGDAIREKARDLGIQDVPNPPYNTRTKTPHPHRRPATAMAGTLDRPQFGKVPALGPYTTTYKREYAAVPGASGRAERPSSTRAFQATYDLGGPIGATNYQGDFYDKGQRKSEPIRTGTSSGNRRNNPHPLETFMNWRLPPRPMAEQDYSKWGEELTDDIMDAVCRGKIRSTYQQDYLGIPQGHQVASAFKDLPEDWKSRVGYSLESSTRRCYQQPSHQPELKGNTVRYGCNKRKHIPANGVVPVVSNRQKHIKERTSYERDFKEPGGTRVAHVRDLGRQYGAEALQKYAGAADGPAQEELAHLLGTMYPRPPSIRPSSSGSGRTCTPSRRRDLPQGCISPTSSRPPSCPSTTFSVFGV